MVDHSSMKMWTVETGLQWERWKEQSWVDKETGQVQEELKGERMENMMKREYDQNTQYETLNLRAKTTRLLKTCKPRPQRYEFKTSLIRLTKKQCTEVQIQVATQVGLVKGGR